MKKNSLRLLGFLLVAVMMVSLLGLGVFAGDTVNDVNETATQPSETLTWKDGDVIDGTTISKDVTINVSGTVTVNGTIRLAPDAICNVVFNGSENAKLIRGEGFTGRMFYAEGTSDNFQKLTFNNITLDGGAVWTGDVDKTLNRGTTNAGVKATGSLLFLMRADAVLNNSVLQNHDDSTGEMTNAVCLRYYSSFTVNDSIVRNNNSIATYYRGGVVTIRQGGTVKTNNADVYGNSGPAGGFVGISSSGAFGGIVEVKDSKFHNNYADNGAVFLMQCNSKIGYLSIDGCEFYENASKTAVLTEWAYSRPFIIKDSYFHDNECAVWDCNADPVLDLSGKIVVEEDADYTKYLFETPLVLSGALTDGSSIAISEASLTKLLSTKAYVVTGTADYAITDTDLAKFVLPEGYKFLVADVNFDGIMDAVPVDVDFVVSQVTVTLKDSLDADASETRTVIAGLAYDYGTSSAHTGFAFTNWQKDDGKAVNAPIAVTSDSILILTAQWKLANPSVDVSVNGATLTATISNANEDIAYTYQWYIDGTAIDGATADTYTMTDFASHKYRCTVTASYEGYKSTSGKREVTASVPAAAQIGDVKYETLAEAIAAANAADGATTVTLLADVTLSEKLTITGDVIIEGAYTITRGDAYTGTLFTVNAGATLTLDGGLTIDGGNNWAYTVFPPVMDLENGSGTKVADHITPAEGGVNATAHMIVNNGTLNVHSVTIENSYSTGEVSLINAGANSVTILDGATIRHTAANRSGAVANIGGIDAILTIKGTTRITDNFGVGNGGIIQNYGQGTTVNLEGGSIDNNFVGKSGTLYASYSSNANKINTFNMTGGIITENVMEGYGPVYIHSNTEWNMSGGEISKNVSYLPSYVRNNNPAGSMTGGKIANNEITGLDYSGGYYLTRPDLRLNGKTAITGGIYSQNVFEYIAPNTGVAYDDGLYTVVSEGLYKLHLTDPVTGEPATIPYIEGNVLASLVATGKLFYADYYEMTLEVLYDVKIDETVVIDYPMTIDLNGHTITGYSTMQTTPVFRVVSDVTVIGEGKVDGRPGSACYAFIVGQGENAGNLTIENGTFYGDISAISVTKGTATINGGKFAVTPYQVEGKEDNYNFLLNCIDKNYKDGTAKIVVKGGTFYKFNPAANAAEGAGTDFVPETHISVDNGDGTFTVWKAVAKVGDTYFATLQDAFAACTNGETITLLVDLVYDADDAVPAHGGATGFGKYDQYNPSIIYIGGTKGATEAENQPSNVNAVLDLNGHTITNNADAYLFLFMDNCKVTIKDSKDGDGIINYANLPIIWACGTDTLVTIENGKYYNGNEAYGSLIHSTHAADIVIKGGEFKTALAEAPDLLKINTQKFNNPNYFLVGKATMTVTGGTFYGFNPEYTGDTYTKTDVDTVPETYAVYDNGDGTITIQKAVAKVGDTYFATLQDAFAACTNGETITLLVDLVYDADDAVPAHGGATGFGKYDQYNPSIIYIGGTKGATEAENQPSNVNAVLDLNGHTITNNADAYLFLFMDNCKVTIKDSKDGDGIIGNTEAPVIWVTGTDTLVTIENGKYTTANAEGLLWSTHGGDLVIKGGEFSTSADDASLLIVRNAKDRRNPNYFIDGKATVTIYGGTFYGFDPEKTMDDSTDPFTEFNAVAEGYMAQDNGDNSWTVVLGKVYNATTGNTFATIADAVADAVNTPGADYLILLQDHEEFLVTILEGMTLDLQDKTLTATYVFAAKGGYLVGNSSTNNNVNNGVTAQLVVPKNNVALSSEAYYSGTSHRVLVWDKTQNAYVFSAVTISTKSSDGLGGFHLMTDELGQYMNVKFKLNASNYVYQNILTGSQADHGIKVVVTASWNTDTGVITQNLVFSDEDVLKTIQNSGWMNTAKVYLQGHDGLVMTVQIVTNTGNVIDSVSMTAAELLEQNNQ